MSTSKKPVKKKAPGSATAKTGKTVTAAKKKVTPIKKVTPKATAASKSTPSAKATNNSSRPASISTKGKGQKPRVGATTAAILGIGAGPKDKTARIIGSRSVNIQPAWAKYYQNLLDLRDRLLEQMNGLAKDSAEEMAGYSLHMADSGTDNFDRDFALSLLSSDQDAIYEIEEALKRIEKHAYGVCELTGKNIPKARLDAIPWTRFTVEAQAQLERDGALRQKRLGALGTVDSAGAVEIEEDDDADEKPAKEKE